MPPVLSLIFGPPVEEQQQGLELLSGPGLYSVYESFIYELIDD